MKNTEIFYKEEARLIEELNFNNTWLTEEYKKSNYYKEYLTKFFEELKTIY